ncbi:hypothetical protein [Streptomyces griseorubiginosus]|uniref:hypothetical protein n=1 Tax=Streptomyces griseorubiginosus TaxID=67304 RepID=UPI001AD64116|nr:hypothetical protein [Streptomyces griseorubiginosus]MBO4259222.1 hypothetical protein [Streptomyces griseorubiginosus]
MDAHGADQEAGGELRLPLQGVGVELGGFLQGKVDIGEADVVTGVGEEVGRFPDSPSRETLTC